MSTLATLLAAPITWGDSATNPDLRHFLEDLQANILKGHGRHHTVNLFLGFQGMPAADVAGVVRLLGNRCTSAFAQLRANRKLPPHTDGGIVRCLVLAASGYRALGAAVPGGAAYQAGMGARGGVLADPPRSAWNAVGWRGAPPDAMMLLANSTPGPLEPELEAIEGWLNGTGVQVLFIERGLQQTRRFRPGVDEGVEHFGYVDGRSQPLFLTEDLAKEGVPEDPAGTLPSAKVHWSPRFNPSQFIVRDPNGRSRLSAGSYFVFRKLEQDVRGFNAAEETLGRAIFGAGANQDQRDRAGAMVVGRFEDGTPLTLSATELKAKVPNDFTYAGDAEGARCPFHAHIRKTNPRGDIERALHDENEAHGRTPIMARRGITYGPERPKSADGSEFADGGHEPQANSGLLFMAYMASIEDQFEFTQQSWADNPVFAGNIDAAKGRPATGADPVIGQTANAAERKHTYQDGWTNSPDKHVLSFEQFVHMQGGEYFFAPSLSFLRGVGL